MIIDWFDVIEILVSAEVESSLNVETIFWEFLFLWIVAYLEFFRAL